MKGVLRLARGKGGALKLRGRDSWEVGNGVPALRVGLFNYKFSNAALDPAQLGVVTSEELLIMIISFQPRMQTYIYPTRSHDIREVIDRIV